MVVAIIRHVARRVCGVKRHQSAGYCEEKLRLCDRFPGKKKQLLQCSEVAVVSVVIMAEQ